MRNVTMISLVVLLNFAHHVQAVADVYKWKDERGVTHYSQLRPYDVVKKQETRRYAERLVELELVSKKTPLATLHELPFAAEQYDPTINPARTESTWVPPTKFAK